MAKMFYTMEETKAALGKNEEEVKQLAREGRLREFRDGPRLMFKADQVEQLKAELGSSPEVISLAPEADSGAPIALADSSQGAGGSVLGLVDSQADAAAPSKEDTHVDIGLSGSLGDVPSPGKAGDSRVGTHSGNVLDVDESRRADPSAQTDVNAAAPDQIALEGAGSGSGLLDLTRESDDTSLGAVFDELTPSGANARRSGGVTPTAAMETQAGEDLAVAVADQSARAQLAAPMYVQGPDAAATALAGAALAGVVILFFGAFVLAAAVVGYRPGIMDDLQKSGLTYLLVAVGVTVIFSVTGFFAGKFAK
ncbi:MAG: hypothetical protein ACM359_04950 [Bacillota bacterium]